MRAPNPPKTTSTAHFERHARLVASCAGKKNGDETGVDCGGNYCAACPSCDDRAKNGDEIGVDCGGSCKACGTCADGVKNKDEEKVDCGGLTCPAYVALH